jgi:hypothetical protein
LISVRGERKGGRNDFENIMVIFFICDNNLFVSIMRLISGEDRGYNERFKKY